MPDDKKKTILFVDDEQRVLDGIRRTLRGMRGSWQMEFASGGAEALELMAHQPVDIIVSDMRMPEMDGASLLLEVMRRHPKTVRLVLSGYSDQEMVLKSVGIAHQYISKPCDAESIHRIVTRTGHLRDFLHSEPLQLLVAEMSSLPSMPSLYTELLEEIRSPLSSTKRIGEIIERDIGMTAKVLQIVNSAFFGLRRQVSSAIEAISLLGQDTVMALALSSAIFSACEVKALGGVSLEAFWADGIRVGALARKLARFESLDSVGQQSAFTAGMLHDVGRLVLASQFPARYDKAMARMREVGSTLLEAEHEEFGASHPEVGAYLLGLWGLPDAIVEAVAYHHRPSGPGDMAFTSLLAVHVANSVIEHVESGKPSEGLDYELLSSLGLDGKYPLWQSIGEQLLAGA